MSTVAPLSPGSRPSADTAAAADSRTDREGSKSDRLIDNRIAEACRALWWAELIRSVLRLVLFAIAALVVWLVVDQWVFSPGRGLRLLVWSGLVAAGAWYLWIRVVPLMRSSVLPEYAARSLERDLPELRQSLTSYVTLRNDPVVPGLRGRVVRSIGGVAAGRLRDYNDLPGEATGTLRWWVATAAALAVLVGYAVISPKNSIQSAARLAAPLASIQPARRVSIADVMPGDAHAIAGRTVDVSARIEGMKDEERAFCRWDLPTGQREVALSQVDSTRQFIGEIELPHSATGIVNYVIVAGDAVAGPFQLQVKDVPVVALQSVHYEPPSYTGQAPHTTSNGAIAALDGTVVTILATTNRAVAKAKIELNPRPIGDRVQATAGASEMTIDADGTTITATFPLRSARGRSAAVEPDSYRIQVWDDSQQSNPEPIVYPIRVIADLPPEVSITLPFQSPTEVPIDAQQAIEVHASDPDFGLQSIGLEIRSGIDLIAAPVLWNDDAGAKGNRVVEFGFRPSQYSLRIGDTVQVVAVAIDNRRFDNDPSIEPNRTRTDPIVLKIVPGDPNAPPPDPRDEDEAGNRPPNQRESSDDQQGTGEAQSGQGGGGSGSAQQAPGDPQSGESQSGESQSGESQSGENSGGSGESAQPQQGDPEGSGGSAGSGGAEGSQSDAQRMPSDGSSGESQTAENSSDQSQGEPSPGQQTSDGSDMTSSPEQNGADQTSDSPTTQNSGESQQSGSTAQSDQTSTADRNSTAGAGDGTGQEASQSPEHDGEAFERIRNYLENKQKQQLESGQGGSQDASNANQQSERQPQADPAAGESQSGESQSGESQTGESQTGESQTGESQTGESQTGESQTGESQTGESQTGESQTGESQSGESQSGESQSGESQSGESQSGESQSGESQSGESQSGESQTGESQSGESQSGESQSGESQSGESQTGESQTGESQTGESQSGESQSGESQSGESQTGESQTGESQSGESQSGESQTGESQTGESQTGESQTGESQTGESQTGESQTGESQSGESTSPNDSSMRPTPRQNGDASQASSSSSPGSAAGSDGAAAEGDAATPPAPANVDYAKKATDLVLDYLDQTRDAPDRELLEDLNWSEQDLRRFAERWQRVREMESSNPSGAGRNSEVEEALKSLGLRPPSEASAAARESADSLRAVRDAGNRKPPPAAHRDAFDAFRRAMGQRSSSGN